MGLYGFVWDCMGLYGIVDCGVRFPEMSSQNHGLKDDEVTERWKFQHHGGFVKTNKVA